MGKEYVNVACVMMSFGTVAGDEKRSDIDPTEPAF